MSSRGFAFDLDRIGAGLPIAQAEKHLTHALESGVMVLSAPPGTGKTTFVPALVANLLQRSTPKTHGSVLLTEPRRVAVRAAARRISELAGCELGDAVGYTVRGERRVSRDTRIEAVTPGVLLRRLLIDPGLERCSAVILDEVHERSVDSDVLIGMLAEVRELRDDLLIVAMSATMEVDNFADILSAPSGSIVEVPATLHPLDVSYAPHTDARLTSRGVSPDYLAHIARTAATAQQGDGSDALVFVPGAREVDEVVRHLRSYARDMRGSAERFEVLPLHGQLPAREQDRAVGGRADGDPPRIVVSTSLAESSLTVPGVRLVVDSGLAREIRRDRIRDMSGLVTVSASRASADQRAGRAARQGPGRAIRVYSETDLAHMPAVSAPEILSADLTDTALLFAAWGTPEGSGLRLPTQPPAGAMSSAAKILSNLGLIRDDGHATKQGKHISLMPVGVREARALIDGTGYLAGPRTSAEAVAAVSDDHREVNADLGQLIRELRSGRSSGSSRWQAESKRLEAILTREANENQHGPQLQKEAVPLEYAPGIICGLARPEWIAKRTGPGSRTYLLASGTRAALPAGSTLLNSEWIAVREVQRAEGMAADGTGAIIRLAAMLSEPLASRIAAPLLREVRRTSIENQRVRVRQERWLGKILLSSSPDTPRGTDTAPAFHAHLQSHGLGELAWSSSALSLRSRLAFLNQVLGDPWPDVTDRSLLTKLNTWLTPELKKMNPHDSLHKLDVSQSLRRLLPWPEASRFDELVPQQLLVPSGSRVQIDYSDAHGETIRPVVAVKLQELFGLAESPCLVDGRVPVLFHLLSPARRPLAITDDLSSFWNGPYRDVRAEMRGRYPKHPWPDDPWSATATAQVTRADRKR